MDINVTKPESMFNSLSVALTTFVSNTFAQYEQEKQVLIEEVKKLRKENEDLKKEVEVHKEQYDIKEKPNGQ